MPQHALCAHGEQRRAQHVRSQPKPPVEGRHLFQQCGLESGYLPLKSDDDAERSPLRENNREEKGDTAGEQSVAASKHGCFCVGRGGSYACYSCKAAAIQNVRTTFKQSVFKHCSKVPDPIVDSRKLKWSQRWYALSAAGDLAIFDSMK